MKILFFHSLFTACEYYRCFLPARTLQQEELVEAKIYQHGEKIDYDWPDVVVFCRGITPTEVDIMQAFKNQGTKVVFDMEDALLHVHKTSHVYPFFNQGWVRENIVTMLKECDTITVTTENLRQDVLQYNQNVHVLPNCMDFTGISLNGKMKNKQVNICWQGGGTHYMDIIQIVDVIKDIIQKYGNKVHFLIFGWDGIYRIQGEGEEYDVFENIPDDMIEFIPACIWKDFYSTLSSLDIDIGLAPLHDNHFNRCKSNLKWLDYIRVSAVTVASNAGPYQEIENGVNGFKCNSYKDWMKVLSRLIENKQLRREIATNALNTVSSKYDIKNNIHKWVEAYNG